MPQIILPGSGFTGATTASPVGSSGTAGYIYKPISRWDAVPNDVKVTPFCFGIIGFHFNDIDRVRFQLDGGPIVEVTAMELNSDASLLPDRPLWDYCVQVRPSDFPTGAAAALVRRELRATVIPRTAGQPRIHQGEVMPDVGRAGSAGQQIGEYSMWFYADPGDTLGARIRYVHNVSGVDTNPGTSVAPFLSIRAAVVNANTAYGNCNHVKIRCMNAASWTWLSTTTFGQLSVTTTNAWLTIEGDPSLLRTAVDIDTNGGGGSTSRLITKWWKRKNLTWATTNNQQDTAEANAWSDGSQHDTGLTGYSGGGWTTNCTHDGGFSSTTGNTPFGSTLSLNDSAINIGVDAGTSGRCIVNRSILHVHRDTTVVPAIHPDLWQLAVPDPISVGFKNCLVYNSISNDANSQSFLFKKDHDAPPYEGIAVVNWHSHDTATPTTGFIGQMADQAGHVLILGSTISGQSFTFREQNPDLPTPPLFAPQDCLRIEGNIFENLNFEGVRTDTNVRIDNNHFVNTADTWGTNRTNGDPQFLDEDGMLFMPMPTSPVRGANRAVQFTALPRDAAGKQRNGSVGAFEAGLAIARGTTFDSRVFAPYVKSAFPAQSMNTGTAVTISAPFYIAGGTSPVWSMANAPAGLSISASTGMITGTVSTAQTITNFQITCTNSRGAVSSAAVQWSVTTSATLPLGSLVVDGPATPEQIALLLPVTGSLPQTATATCRYKLTSTGTWTIGHPLYRIRPTFSEAPAVGTVIDAFAWPIIGLTPGAAYDVEVTVTSGATVNVKTLTTTTRTLPAAAGAANKTANSVATITSQLAALNPGDVLEIAAGTYATGLVLTRSGTAASPIYIRGASRTGTIISKTTGAVVNPQNASHVILENMTLRGAQVDTDNRDGTGYHFAIYWNGTQTSTNFTARNLLIVGTDFGISSDNELTGALVYNNTLTGNNQWTVAWTETNLGWNDDGIRLPGQGNCVFQNTLRGFGDALSFADHVSGNTNTETQSLHFYRNDITMTVDDGSEVDHAMRNCSLYDNRWHNSMTTFSLDPLYAGPLLVARNIWINVGRASFKWNSAQSGMFVYNNTLVRTTGFNWLRGDTGEEAAWYQPGNGDQRSYGFRNNLVIYRGVSLQTLRLDNTGHDPVDFTHNSWYPQSGAANSWQWQSGSAATLAAMYAGLPATTPVFSGQTKRHEQDSISVSDPFTTPVTLGANYRTEVTTAYTPTLATGTAPKNSGVAIANITDRPGASFTGTLPDRGALISGLGIPLWGDQTAAEPVGGIPDYVNALAAYQVRKLTGTWSPSNGRETMLQATSAVDPNWAGHESGPGGAEGDLQYVINAWCGGGKGDWGTPKMWVHGGGHGDSYNNGMYEFDFSQGAANKPVGWNLRKISPISAIIQNANAYADGLPTSVHSYDGLIDHPNGFFYRFRGNAAGESGSGGATSMWKFNKSTFVWTNLGAYPGGVEGGSGTMVLDPTTGKMLQYGHQSVTDWRFFRTAGAQADTWSGAKILGVLGLDEPMSCYRPVPGNPNLGHMFLFGSTGTGVRLVSVDWVNESISGGSTISPSSPIMGQSGISAVYDVGTDRIWLWGGRETSPGWTTLYSMLPTAPYTITPHTLSFQNGGFAFYPSNDSRGSFSRFVFHPTWRMIGLVTSTHDAAYVIKLPATGSVP